MLSQSLYHPPHHSISQNVIDTKLDQSDPDTLSCKSYILHILQRDNPLPAHLQGSPPLRRERNQQSTRLDTLFSSYIPWLFLTFANPTSLNSIDSYCGRRISSPHTISANTLADGHEMRFENIKTRRIARP